MLRIMTDKPTIRPLAPQDLTAMLALMPQLADFEVPPSRNPDDLWTSDARLLEQVAAGKSEHSFAEVVVNEADDAIGLILVTMREELMSHAPSAHLEAIVVDPQARGLGLGESLLAQAEQSAKARGAESLSLHVFANNRRARGLYDKQGYDSELIRAIKWFE
jgi:ribosomal protein S18 acetylase RimI-like enzyme